MKRRVHLRPIADILRELGACEKGVAAVAGFGTDYAAAWEFWQTHAVSQCYWLSERVAGTACDCWPGCPEKQPTRKSIALASAPWPKMKAALIAYGIDFVDRKGWRAHPCGIGATNG